MVMIEERTREAFVEVSAPTPVARPVPAAEVAGTDRTITTGYVWGTLRLAMGWVFLWGFIDKLFGLGYATARDAAWINGGSPTFGFLNFGAKGPFAELYKSIAGNVIVDWSFMMGLPLIGLPLMLGIGVRLAATGGVLMLTLMYTAGFILPEHNLFLDEHIVYAVIMVGLIMAGSGRYLGFGGWWSTTRLVERFPVLK